MGHDSCKLLLLVGKAFVFPPHRLVPCAWMEQRGDYSEMSGNVALFCCAPWQRCHIRNAPFVLTQFGWFLLSQRSDAKSPGAEAPGLFSEWQACHSI